MPLLRAFRLLSAGLCVSFAAEVPAQSFEETWLEFLDNNKIVNISALRKPDKVFDTEDYAKYLLMNMNSDFCQSDVPAAEEILAEIRDLDPKVLEAVPGFVPKLEGLEVKDRAYHRVDEIWRQFLETRQVPVDKLNEIEGVRTTCEKGTLAKYSYMLASAKYCDGDIAGARDIFQNRTLRLAEKTSWKFRDVEGLVAEVKKMETIYAALPPLERAWSTFVETGVSPGFGAEIPTVGCYPVPTIKALLLRGAADVCGEGAAAVAEVGRLRATSGVALPDDVNDALLDLEDATLDRGAALADLNAAWEAFLPDGKVKYGTRYGYDYCETEPLIRAYIMDGYTYVCELGNLTARRVDSLQQIRRVRLDRDTKQKLGELAELEDRYRFHGSRIEGVWDQFVAEGDTLTADYISTEEYCDQIQQVKDWTIRGLSGDCEAAVAYLNEIEEFNRRFEFTFYDELECRVQKLRIKVWECRFRLLHELATVESEQGAEGVTYDERIAALMAEYQLDVRPEECMR